MFQNSQGKNSETTPYFYEPLLQMGYAGRLALRMIMRTALIVHAAATFVALLSDISWVFWLGVGNALYLLDRLAHARRPDYDLTVHKGVVNVALYLTPKAKQVLVAAYDRASIAGGSLFLHVARILAESRLLDGVFLRLEVGRDEFISYLDKELSKQVAPVRRREQLLGEAERLAVAAYTLHGASDRSLDHILLFAALATVGDEQIDAILNLLEVEPEDVRHAAVFERLTKHVWMMRLIRRFSVFPQRRARHRVMNRAWTARSTPLLDAFSQDLTDAARAGSVGLLVGHQVEYRRLVDSLSDPSTPNVVLVGEAGVGKRAIVEHLAAQIVHDNVPRQLFDRRVVLLDIGALVAGADPAALQGRVRKIFDELYRAGNIILFIPHVHTLYKTVGSAELTVAETLLPLIADRGIPTIGATTPGEFKRLLEPVGQFRKAFEVIRVEEVTEDEAREILVYRSAVFEREHRVRIAYPAVKTAVRLAQRYFSGTPLPTSAVELLKEAILFVRNKGERLVQSDDVVQVAEERTQSPIHEASKEEAAELLNLEEVIHRRLIDQEDAVRAVSEALRAQRSGLGEKGKPIGVFLFVGPTGVGKTELAKTLAEVQFGSEDAMVRFDMSEYQESESIHRFIGSPDGRVAGALTDALRERPYRLILLDEFEKAHPNILKLFLQVFDDGRLTDGLGRVVRFEESMIIATSNAEANFIKESIEAGKSVDEIKTELIDRLSRLFSPELLNRFTDVIVFKSLGQEEIEAVARLRLGELAKQLKDAQGIELQLEEEAVRYLARLGYDPVFGARPLERVIREQLVSRLSEKILAGDLKRGMRATVRSVGDSLRIYEEP